MQFSINFCSSNGVGWKGNSERIYYSKEVGVATFLTRSGGKDIWIVLNDFEGAKTGNFELNILEMEAMKQDIAASEMLEALNKNGSVALYINFETGKADIKPESQKTVMKAVAAGSVDGARLTAKGWGQEKPVADNNTDEGKAKSRRVEIVKM